MASHDHSYEAESYFLDQICMVGLSGAFGVIGLTLYTWRYDMLKLLLGEQFHAYVLASGIALLLIAVVRGVSLWFQAAPAHEHTHDHAHGECGHDHAHGDCGHDHAHEHAHDHSHDDHDHGWAPWRYVVLLLPILLFMLGLPNKTPGIAKSDTKIDTTADAMSYASLIVAGPSFGQTALAMQLLGTPSLKDPTPVNYKVLESLAESSTQRSDWQGKAVEVRGQFAPDARGNEHVFNLVRLKISCCANDTIQLNVPMICRDGIQGIHQGEWVKVKGLVDFIEQNGKHRTILRIPSASDVETARPDLNPYVQ